MSTFQSGLVSFITVLEPEQLEALFVHPYAVVALLRSLPPLARQVLLRFACTGGSLSTALVASWARPGGDAKLTAALRELTALRLLSRVAQPSQAESYAVHPGFQAQLRRAMCNGLTGSLPGATETPPPGAAPSAAQLSAFAQAQWESLLLYLVDPSVPPPAMPAGLHAPSVGVPGLLAGAGLMVKNEYTLKQDISKRGFQFLLADLYTQLWGVVRQYLEQLGGSGTAGSASSGGGPASLTVAINFLLRLGLQAGRPMSFAQLGEAEQQIAAHMAQLGMLMPVGGGRGGADLWLHPTRLASVLAGGGRAGESAAAAVAEGFVIVESNFRVYAYTTSAVQVAILRVFVRCDVLLPNLFVGTITRDSAASALALGITADQMAGFLRQHVHPRVTAKPPIVPSVVAEQLRLWQQERTRLRAQAATFYARFDSPELFSGAVAHARQLGALLYCSEERQQLAVEAAFHDVMRAHLRERKAALGL